MPPNAVEHSAGSRKFLSGPFEFGFGMLLTPTCSMTAQGEEGNYAHAVRMLAPVLPLERLVESGAIKAGSVPDMRVRDHLVNYFYLPAIPDADMPESMALIYSSITLHHDYLEDRRVAQLSESTEIHLKYKLTALYGGEIFSHEDFTSG